MIQIEVNGADKNMRFSPGSNLARSKPHTTAVHVLTIVALAPRIYPVGKLRAQDYYL